MTDPAIISASYAAEVSRTWDLGDVVDSSDSIVAIATTQENTTELKDISGNLNHATIKGSMRDEGFMRGMRFGGVDDELIVFSSGQNLNAGEIEFLFSPNSTASNQRLFYSNFSNRIEVFYNIFGNGKIRFNIDNGGWIELDSIKDDWILGVRYFVSLKWTNQYTKIFVDGVENSSRSTDAGSVSLQSLEIGGRAGVGFSEIITNFITVKNHINDTENVFNSVAVLPFWSISYTDYPNNVTTYTERLPYSSTIISAGEFKVDADILDCVAAGTITYRAAHKFDGGEYIKITIAGIEYSGTGTITQGNTTVSIAQGSNIITIAMGTGDTIDAVDIQFRETV